MENEAGTVESSLLSLVVWGKIIKRLNDSDEAE